MRCISPACRTSTYSSQIRSRDGEKFDALEQRVAGVFSFFEHTPVELHPGVIAPVEKLDFWCTFWPFSVQFAVLAVYRFPLLFGTGSRLPVEHTYGTDTVRGRSATLNREE